MSLHHESCPVSVSPITPSLSQAEGYPQHEQQKRYQIIHTIRYHRFTLRDDEIRIVEMRKKIYGDSVYKQNVKDIKERDRRLREGKMVMLRMTTLR